MLRTEFNLRYCVFNEEHKQLQQQQQQQTRSPLHYDDARWGAENIVNAYLDSIVYVVFLIAGSYYLHNIPRLLHNIPRSFTLGILRR